MTEITRLQPDVIVLDLMKNEFGELQVNAGAPVGLQIWKKAVLSTDLLHGIRRESLMSMNIHSLR